MAKPIAALISTKTLEAMKDELVDVWNMLNDQKLPIDELIGECSKKIYHCIDELYFYCKEEEENESKRTN